MRRLSIVAALAAATVAGLCWSDGASARGPDTQARSSASARLTVAVTGDGRVIGAGIDCGGGGTDCTQTYPVGTTVALTATPKAPATFSGWGGACAGSRVACTLLMSGSRSVTAAFSTPTGRGGTGPKPKPAVVPFSAHGLGRPIVVRKPGGWAVSLRFVTSRPAAALVRLMLGGRLVNAFSFSPQAGTVLVGPFSIGAPGRYRFQLTLDDRGTVRRLSWTLCLGGCGAFRPAAAFVRSLGVTTSRSSPGWTVRVRFRAAGTGTASIRMTRAGRIVSTGRFSFHAGTVIVNLPARSRGAHRIVLEARTAAGRTYRLTWTVRV